MMLKRRHLSYAAAFLFASFLIVNSSWLERLLADHASAGVSKALGAAVHIRELKYSLLARRVDLAGLTVLGKDGQPFLSCERITVVFRPWLPLDFYTSEKDVIVSGVKIDLRHPMPAAKASGGTLPAAHLRINQARLDSSFPPVEHIRLEAELTGKEVTLRSLQGEFQGMKLSFSGKITDASTFAGEGSGAFSGDVRQISELLRQDGYSGNATGEVSLHRDRTATRVEVTLKESRLAYRSLPAFSVQAILNADLSGNCPYVHASGKILSLPVAAFEKHAPWMRDELETVSGEFSYAGDIDWRKGNGTLDASLYGSGGELSGIAVHSALDLQDGTIHIRRAESTLGALQLAASGTATEGRADLKIHLVAGDARILAARFPSLQKIRASADVEAAITGPWPDLQIDGTATVIAGRTPVQVKARYAAKTHNIDAAISGDLPLQALTDTAKGRLVIRGRVTGSTEDPQFRASLQSTDLSWSGQPVGRMDSRLEGSLSRATLNLELPDLHAQVEGTLYPDRGEYALRSTMKETRIQNNGVSARITGTVSASGRWLDWKSSKATLELQEVTFVTPDQHEFPLHANADFQKGVLRGTLASSSKEIALNATYQPGTDDYEIEGTLNLTTLERLQPYLPASAREIRGSCQASFHSKGRLKTWRASSGEASISDASFRWKGQSYRLEPGGALNWERGRVHVDAAMEGDRARLRLRGEVIPESRSLVDFSVSGEADARLIGELSSQLESSGMLKMDVRMTGSYPDLEIEGQLAGSDLEIIHRASSTVFSQGSLVLQGQKSQLLLNLQGRLNEGTLSAIASMQKGATNPEVHVQLHSVDLHRFAPSVSGTIDLDLKAHGPDLKAESLQGDLTLSPASIHVGEAIFRSVDGLHANYARGIVKVDPFLLQVENNFLLQTEGSYDLSTTVLRARSNLRMDLEVISAMSPKFNTSGKLEVSLKADGRISDFPFEGEVRIENGAFQMPGMPVQLDKIDLLLAASRNELALRTFSANSGGGQIQGGGELRFDGAGTQGLWLRAERVGVMYPEPLRSVLKADLSLRKAQGSLLVEGIVQSIRSSFTEEFGFPKNEVKAILSEDPEAESTSTLKRLFRLNLQVATLNPIVARNSTVRGRADLAMTIEGTLDRPLYRGDVQIEPGTAVFFEGQEYEVDRGLIRFPSGPVLVPHLDLLLVTNVEDSNTNIEYEVYLPLSGNLSHLAYSTPRSSPPLAPRQIYSLLLYKNTNSNVGESASAVFQSQLAQYMLGYLVQSRSSKFAQTIGLSRISMQREMSSESDTGTKVLLQRDFPAGFSMIYSVELDDASNNTAMARYRAGRSIEARLLQDDREGFTGSFRQNLRFGSGQSPGSFRKSSPARAVVESVRVTSDGPITESEVRKRLGVKEGEPYRYWPLYDRAARLRAELFAAGYLFPAVEIQVEDPAAKAIALQVNVIAGRKGAVHFEGGGLPDAAVARYRKAWLDSLTETLAPGIVSDLIASDFQRQSYHRASVKVETVSSGAGADVFFRISAGLPYQSRIQFQGVQFLSPDQLLKEQQQFYSSAGALMYDAFHNPQDYADSLRAVLIAHGYFKSRVTMGSIAYVDAERQASRMVTVEEGPLTSVSEIVFTPDLGLPAALVARISMKAGAIPLRSLMERDCDTITDYLKAQGFLQASVESAVARNGEKLSVEYRILQGSLNRIANIRISGNVRTQAAFLERTLGIRTGDVVTQDLLFAAQDRLNTLATIRAEMHVEPTTTPGQVDLVLNVTEQKRYEFLYGVRESQNQGFGVEAGLADNNFLGRGATLSVYGRHSMDYQIYRLDYYPAPSSGMGRWILSAIRESEQLNLVEGFDVFLDARYSRFELEKEFQLSRTWKMLAKLESGPINIDLQLPRIKFSLGSAWFSALTGSLYRDTRDDPLNPSRGWFVSVSTDFAPGLVSDITTIRQYGQVYNYRRWGRWTWAYGVRAGWAHFNNTANDQVGILQAVLNLQESFQTGGSTTIRGFQKNQVRSTDDPEGLASGEGVFVLNQELRIALNSWVGAAIFYDGGNIYKVLGDFDPLNLRNTAGFGVRLLQPLPLRLDIGFNLDPHTFHLSLPDGTENEIREPRYVIHFGVGQAF